MFPGLELVSGHREDLDPLKSEIPKPLPSLGRDEAATIVTPYQQHHGDADAVVPLRMDQLLDEVLTAHAVEHELLVYSGYDHPMMARDATMLARVRDWYTAHGLF